MIDKIFTFWEPRTGLTPYLELCKETWEANLRANEIVVLDHANLADYIGNDALDLDILKRFPLPVQKDAIMVALLKAHGGVFMDMDTIAVRDIEPLVQRLQYSEVVMFDSHMAFMAARANARVLSLIFDGIQKKLAAVRTQNTSQVNVDGCYLGNSELTRARRTMIAKQLWLPTFFVNRCSQTAKKWSKKQGTLSWASRLLDRTKRLTLAMCRDQIAQLNRDEYGFIAESGYGNYSSDPKRTYLDFWFEHDVEPNEVFCDNQMIIGLHNSWTPEWYKNLDRQGVLSHRCPLSRTLRHVLKG